MTSLNDEQLLRYSERSKGKVVLVTGTCHCANLLARSANFCHTRAMDQVLRLGLGKKLRWPLPNSSKLSKNKSFDSRTCIECVIRCRAKLVLGDLNAAGIDEVVKQIKKSGGYVVSRRSSEIGRRWIARGSLRRTFATGRRLARSVTSQIGIASWLCLSLGYRHLVPWTWWYSPLL